MMIPYAQNMMSSKGNIVPNQFIITTGDGWFLQSYHNIIAFKSLNAGKPTQLSIEYWDYSVTTGRYRNQFLGETKKETEKKIKTGEYVLVDFIN